MPGEQGKNEFQNRVTSYTVRLIKFLRRTPDDTITVEIKKQLVRSGTSIGADYYESRGASSKRGFALFFRRGLKSANETRYRLRVLSESDSLPRELETEYNWLSQETEELARILSSSIMTLKGAT